MTKKQKEKQNEARETLRAMLKPGDTIYTVLRHVSRSGMSRRIDLYAIIDGNPQWLSGYAKTALGEKRGKYDAMTVGGCGMDMGFHIVSTLSRVLYPEGFGCIGKPNGDSEKWCPSNDHSNGDRDYTPHVSATPQSGYSFPHWHKVGDYALRHRWM